MLSINEKMVIISNKGNIAILILNLKPLGFPKKLVITKWMGLGGLFIEL